MKPAHAPARDYPAKPDKAYLFATCLVDQDGWARRRTTPITAPARPCGLIQERKP